MTASIDVAFTPADVRDTEVAVVVDVLRASSTIVTALAAGLRQVLCAADVDTARGLRGPGRALAGEQKCRPIEGFDYGNSPEALQSAPEAELVLCTTNGTPAIIAAADAADEVIVAALLNLDAVLGAVPEGSEVTIVCSGTDKRFALEDAYLAGRLVDRLSGKRTDAALAAERLAASYPDPQTPLGQCADAAVLKATGQTADIAFCAQESVFDVVPRVTTVDAGVAIVAQTSDKDNPMDQAKPLLGLSVLRRTLSV